MFVPRRLPQRYVKWQLLSHNLSIFKKTELFLFKKYKTFCADCLDKSKILVYNTKVSVSISLLNLFKSEGREKENGRS